MARADTILAVGTELSEDLYGNPISFKGTLIQIDLDTAAFECNLRTDIALNSDACSTLGALLEKIPAVGDKMPRGRDRVDDLKTRIQGEKQTVLAYDDFALMLEILDGVRKALPEDAIFCADSTSAAYVGYSEFPAYLPSTYIYPCGFGTLGLALPAAIGAKSAYPERAVCALAGDGGFQFTMAEIGVACQEKLCVPLIIWDNGGFGEIRNYEEIRHPGRRIAVDHQNPDFLKLAEAYGITGSEVTNGDEMKEALEKALAEKGPSIILINSK